MRKETWTYNELGEFLMALGIGKRTGHGTLKKCKGKSLPTIPPKQYKQLQDNKRFTMLPYRGHWIWIHFEELLARFHWIYSNTASMNARDPILRTEDMNLTGFRRVGHKILSARVTSTQPTPNPTTLLQPLTIQKLQLCLIKRYVTTLPWETELLTTSGD